MSYQTYALASPLRQTPERFRLCFGFGVVATLGGFALLLSLAPGPSLAVLVREPGFLLLVGLALLADLYPLVPWMRDVRANVTFAWSAVMSMAAVLAYGPHAAVLFVLSGCAASLARRNGRWWRPVVNTVTFGLIGLVVAGLTAAIGFRIPPALPEEASRLILWGFAMAAVIQLLNWLLIAAALVLLAASNWSAERAKFAKSARVWGVSLLTAPLLASLALLDPATLSVMAVVVVTLNNLSGTMFRSTTQARTDALTGLANRSTLTRTLSTKIERLGSGQQSVTLLLVDLNGFKAVNDTYGHLVGDEVLQVVARRLARATRPDDLVARYGGDEFAVVLDSAVTPGITAAVRDRICEAVAVPMRVREHFIEVGASVGAGTTTDPTASALDLVAEADRDMYRMKRGRLAALGPLAPARDLAPVVADASGAVPTLARPVRPVTQGSEAPPASVVLAPLLTVARAPAACPVWSMSAQGTQSWPGVHWSALALHGGVRSAASEPGPPER